jgi:hypothetical protein
MIYPDKLRLGYIVEDMMGKQTHTHTSDVALWFYQAWLAGKSAN